MIDIQAEHSDRSMQHVPMQLGKCIQDIKEASGVTAAAVIPRPMTAADESRLPLEIPTPITFVYFFVITCQGVPPLSSFSFLLIIHCILLIIIHCI